MIDDKVIRGMILALPWWFASIRFFSFPSQLFQIKYIIKGMKGDGIPSTYSFVGLSTNP